MDEADILALSLNVQLEPGCLGLKPLKPGHAVVNGCVIQNSPFATFMPELWCRADPDPTQWDRQARVGIPCSRCMPTNLRLFLSSELTLSPREVLKCAENYVASDWN